MTSTPLCTREPMVIRQKKQRPQRRKPDCLFANNKISYVEKSYKIFKTNTELKVKFSDVEGHKVNIKNELYFYMPIANSWEAKF